MRKLSTYIAILMLMGIASGCAPKVRSDFDKTFNFAGLKQYALMPSASSQTGKLPAGPKVDQRMQQILHDTLAAKGYSRSSKPDFYLRYRLISKLRISRAPGINLGYIGGNMGMGMYNNRFREKYETAGLTISIYDDKENLLWRGAAEKEWNTHNKDPLYTDGLMVKLVTAVLNKFPPKNE